MMSARMANRGLIKITTFWNKGHHVIIPDNDVTSKILSCDLSYIVHVSMWPSFLILAFLWETLSQPQFYKGLSKKTTFFEGWSWFKFNNLRLTLSTKLKFNTSVEKRFKLKVRKLGRPHPTFVEVTGEKLVGCLFASPLHPE